MKERIQGLMPSILALSFILFLLIYSVMLFVNSVEMNGYAKATLVLLYAIWILAEYKTTSGEVKKGNTEKDGNSLEFYALSRGVMITTTVLASRHFEFLSPITFIGMIIFLSCIYLRFYAINTLGAFYSHRVRIKSDHQIIDYGPYKYLRHPAYTGMVCANLGFVLIFYSVWGFLAFLCIFLPAIVYRITIEEKALFNMENYEKVMGPKKRLLPFIW